MTSGPLSAYAPHDGHEEHGQAATAVAERRGHGAGDRADCGRRLGRGRPKHRYGGLHLISQLTSTGDGPCFGVCCASTRPFIDSLDGTAFPRGNRAAASGKDYFVCRLVQADRPRARRAVLVVVFARPGGEGKRSQVVVVPAGVGDGPACAADAETGRLCRRTCGAGAVARRPGRPLPAPAAGQWPGPAQSANQSACS